MMINTTRALPVVSGFDFSGTVEQIGDLVFWVLDLEIRSMVCYHCNGNPGVHSRNILSLITPSLPTFPGKFPQEKQQDYPWLD